MIGNYWLQTEWGKIWLNFKKPLTYIKSQGNRLGTNHSSVLLGVCEFIKSPQKVTRREKEKREKRKVGGDLYNFFFS